MCALAPKARNTANSLSLSFIDANSIVVIQMSAVAKISHEMTLKLISTTPTIFQSSRKAKAGKMALRGSGIY